MNWHNFILYLLFLIYTYLVFFVYWVLVDNEERGVIHETNRRKKGIRER